MAPKEARWLAKGASSARNRGPVSARSATQKWPCWTTFIELQLASKPVGRTGKEWAKGGKGWALQSSALSSHLSCWGRPLAGRLLGAIVGGSRGRALRHGQVLSAIQRGRVSKLIESGAGPQAWCSRGKRLTIALRLSGGRLAAVYAALLRSPHCSFRGAKGAPTHSHYQSIRAARARPNCRSFSNAEGAPAGGSSWSAAARLRRRTSRRPGAKMGEL